MSSAQSFFLVKILYCKLKEKAHIKEKSIVKKKRYMKSVLFFLKIRFNCTCTTNSYVCFPCKFED